MQETKTVPDQPMRSSNRDACGGHSGIQAENNFRLSHVVAQYLKFQGANRDVTGRPAFRLANHILQLILLGL